MTTRTAIRAEAQWLIGITGWRAAHLFPKGQQMAACRTAAQRGKVLAFPLDQDPRCKRCLRHEAAP